MTIRTIKTGRLPVVRQSLTALLDQYLPVIREQEILVVTSKIVSICEGRFVGRDAVHKRELIERGADWFLPPERSAFGVALTIKNFRLIPNAGIDESNADGRYILWPDDVQKTANALRTHLSKRSSVRHVGLLITDSSTVPLRSGVTGIALAHSGFCALNNYIGSPDLFCRALRMTRANVAEALAAAAVLVMGEASEATPLAVINDVPFVFFQDRDPSESELEELRINPGSDPYAPLLRGVPWQTTRVAPCLTTPDS